VRRIAILIGLTLLMSRAAQAQSFELYGSGGPTVTDAGNSFAVGAGFSPTSHFTFAFSFDRTHTSSRTTENFGRVSNYRGTTFYLGTAELRVAPFGRTRVRPFGLVGFAAGVSRPNVNEIFQDRVTNPVRAMFIGGGIEVPLDERFAIFADGRLMYGAEGTEGLLAIAPIRAGVAWRF
jgi:Outer membrane protein beta-barrel domain